MQASLGTIVCKFGDDRVTFVVEEAICAKFTDRQTETDRQTDRRTTDASRLHKLILWNELIKMNNVYTVHCTRRPNNKRKKCAGQPSKSCSNNGTYAIITALVTF